MLLPGQAKPILRQPAVDAKTVAAVRATVLPATTIPITSATTNCIINCGALDPVARSICSQNCF